MNSNHFCHVWLATLRKGTFFLGGRVGASEGKVISKSEHLKGRVIPFCKQFKLRDTLFPEFLNEIFCDVLSILLIV